MRGESLSRRLEGRFVATAGSRHSLRTYPDLPAGIAPGGPDEAWVADATHARPPQSFVCPACAPDAYSRGCVGWAPSRSTDTRLTLAALEAAIEGRRPPRGSIHRSGRGVQYAAGDCVGRLGGAGARVSVPAGGDPYGDAKAESFPKTLKAEGVRPEGHEALGEAEADIGRFVEGVYSTKRPHSSPGYRTPAGLEAAHTGELTLAGARQQGFTPRCSFSG